MNIILFEAAELSPPPLCSSPARPGPSDQFSGSSGGAYQGSGSLGKHDERTVHLVKVLRKKPGDFFDAGVVQGPLGRARLDTLAANGAITFSFTALSYPPPLFPIRVMVGFPRPIQLRRLLRDLANLGVAAIDLVGTELGEKSYRDTKLLSDGGSHQALVEGAIQARDTQLPSLTAWDRLDQYLAAAPWQAGVPGDEPHLPSGGKAAPVLVALDNVRPAASFTALPLPGLAPIVLAIGSERGWSETERTCLEKAGFIRLAMGSRALRTETACTAAVVLALEKMGHLS